MATTKPTKQPAEQVIEEQAPVIQEQGPKSLQVLQRENDAKVNNLMREQVNMAETYRTETQHEVTISPMYAPHFGKNMPVILNGIAIYIPVDGRTYKVPESFAMEIRGRIRAVDDQLNRQKRLSDVQSNHERYAGELSLVTPVR